MASLSVKGAALRVEVHIKEKRVRRRKSGVIKNFHPYNIFVTIMINIKNYAIKKFKKTVLTFMIPYKLLGFEN
jgi:hypothetical protein